MNYLISSSIVKLLRDHNIETSFSIMQQAGFDAVDFPLCNFCEHDDAPMKQPTWREWAQSVRDMADKYGLIIGQAHAHWRMETPVNEDFSCDAPAEIIHNNFEVCKIWGTRRLIFHPCQRYFRLPDAADRQKVLDANVEWFRQLLPTAEKWDVEIHIENLFDHKHVQREGDPRLAFCTPEDILYIVNQLNHPLVKICLDTGHANINAMDIPRMIRMYGKKLASLHLNDNLGKIYPIYEDVHMFPCAGRVPMADIFAALHEVGYEGTLNMEPNGSLPGQAMNIQIIRLRAARDVTAALMENAQNV